MRARELSAQRQINTNRQRNRTSFKVWKCKPKYGNQIFNAVIDCMNCLISVSHEKAYKTELAKLGLVEFQLIWKTFDLRDYFFTAFEKNINCLYESWKVFKNVKL